MPTSNDGTISIPDKVDDISAEWLTAALQGGGAIDCRIAKAEFERIGEGRGNLSSIVSCRLHYDAPSGGEPPVVIVKIEPEGERFRESVEFSHGFEREIRFYREVAPLAPIRLPKFYYGAYDAHRAVIILEDLSQLQSRSQIHGLDDADTLAAVQQIARMHARFWSNDMLERFQWMPVHDERMTLNFAQYWDRFVDAYGLRIGKDAIALGNRLRESLDWLRNEIATRPRTVCHGDFRADNLFFGDAHASDDVVIFDWQLCGRSLGAVDLARLVGGSEPPAERRTHHMNAFAAWHETLLSEGVDDYPRDAALADFRLGALVHLCTPVRVFSVMGDEPGGRRGQFLDAIATRFYASALEIDAADRLP